MTPHKTKRTKPRRNKKAPYLSDMSRKAIDVLRRMPKAKARFSLYLTSEGTKRRVVVITNGDGIPDSTYYVHTTITGTIPPNLPPTATYVAHDRAEAETILCWIADNPDLLSKDGGDALDRLDVEPYEDDPEGERD